jgi:hypothetical protein
MELVAHQPQLREHGAARRRRTRVLFRTDALAFAIGDSLIRDSIVIVDFFNHESRITNDE